MAVTAESLSLAAIPSPHDVVVPVQPGWRTITEGAAVVWYPGPDSVFYNKVYILIGSRRSVASLLFIAC